MKSNPYALQSPPLSTSPLFSQFLSKMAPKRATSDPESSPNHGPEDGKLVPHNSHSDHSDSTAGDKDAPNSAAADKDAPDSAQSDQSDQVAPTPTPAAQRSARVADSSIKPIKSRPMDSISGSKRPVSRPAVSHPRSKRSKVISPSPSKGRIWGKEDEIVLLNGILDYQSKKGALPSAGKETEVLHGLIRGSLGIKVSNSQLYDKMRGLKRKYNRAILRGKNETDPSFSDNHEKTIFMLSKTIWGPVKTVIDLPNPLISDDDTDKDTNNDDYNFSPLNNNTVNGHVEGQNGNNNNKSEEVMYPYLTEMVENIPEGDFNGAFLKRALLGLEGSKAMAIEKKIKKFRSDEIELGLRRIELVKESVKVLLDGVKKSE